MMKWPDRVPHVLAPVICLGVAFFLICLLDSRVMAQEASGGGAPGGAPTGLGGAGLSGGPGEGSGFGQGFAGGSGGYGGEGDGQDEYGGEEAGGFGGREGFEYGSYGDMGGMSGMGDGMAMGGMGMYAGTSPGRNVPQLILTRPLPEQAQRELTEDLQVMDLLLTRAIGGDSARSNPYTRVLGVMVNNRDEQQHRIQFVQDHAVIFSYEVSIPLAPDKYELAPGAGPASESDWDNARRMLFTQPVPGMMGGGGSMGRNGSRQRYNSEIVETLKDRVTRALKNITHIRQLNLPEKAPEDPYAAQRPQPTVLVVIRSESDQSAMTMSTRADLIRGADDGSPADAVTVHQYVTGSATAGFSGGMMPAGGGAGIGYPGMGAGGYPGMGSGGYPGMGSGYPGAGGGDGFPEGYPGVGFPGGGAGSGRTDGSAGQPDAPGTSGGADGGAGAEGSPRIQKR